MQDTTNTIKQHEVLAQPRDSSTAPLHPRAPRRPGRACKTDPIKWSDRKKLAIESLESKWRELKEPNHEDGRDGAEGSPGTSSKFVLLNSPCIHPVLRGSTMGSTFAVRVPAHVRTTVRTVAVFRQPTHLGLDSVENS